SSLLNSGMYEMDFGWGKPIWFYNMHAGVNRFVYINDTPKGDGVEATVTLSPEEMEIFERDSELLSYAIVDPNPLQYLNQSCQSQSNSQSPSSRDDDNMLDADWRSFRARLVAGEQAFSSHESSPSNDPDMVVNQPQSILIGDKWAHAIHEPEKGCLLIATEKLDGVHIFERAPRWENDPGKLGADPDSLILRRSQQPFILEESPVDTMADQRTMAELLRAPTEGYAEAIVVPPILAEQFELKHSLINMMTSDQFFGLEKDNPHEHIRWDNIQGYVSAAVVNYNQGNPGYRPPATPPLAFVKFIEDICVTCGGAHPYYQCLTVDGNTFPEFQDNIQGYVSADAVN
nr:transferase, chloramphenicol acetyltransferase-like domain protein [Tanacetum cinerariifolium]